MGSYFDLFPKVQYDVNGNLLSNYELLTNITFRFGFIQKVINNISAYITYTVRDGDTPEILAEKYYGDTEAHWIILLANNIHDPQYDWPLDDRSFRKYLIGKYGSIANAKTTIHHYEKVIQRKDSTGDISHETRFEINYNTLSDAYLTLSEVQGDFTEGDQVSTNNALFTANTVAWSNSNNLIQLSNTTGTLIRYQTLSSGNASGVITDIVYPTVPYEYYLSLPDTLEFNTYNIEGRTIHESIFRDAISNYDYEFKKNEDKRQIKLVKKEYYVQIIDEFDRMTKNSRNPFLRTLR